MKIRILVVASSEALLRRFGRLASTPNSEVRSRAPSPEVWRTLGQEPFDLLFTTRADLPMPLAEFTRSVRALPEEPDVVVLTPEEDSEEQARGIAEGALAVVHTRLPDTLLRPMLVALKRRVRAVQEGDVDVAANAIEPELSDFVAESLAMKRLLSMSERIASTNTSVLMVGETGVGKEWLARSLHRRSPRASAPFIAVNCAAVPEGLFESELFGHVEGAFTGAIATRRGYFELAHGGTMFLDEIGELPRSLQAKLLRVLEEDEIRPVGSEETIALDARLMVSTNRNLESAIAAREFRRDLFYRISVVTLLVPPLRERREDIPGLAENYLERFSIELKRPIESIHPAAIRALLDYSWPGNVRELINVMERSVLLSRGRELTLADLPRSVIEGDGSRPVQSLGPHETFEESWLEEPLAEVRGRMARLTEREYLARMLARSGGRIGETARRARISPRTLFNKMRSHGLHKEDYKF